MQAKEEGPWRARQDRNSEHHQGLMFCGQCHGDPPRFKQVLEPNRFCMSQKVGTCLQLLERTHRDDPIVLDGLETLSQRAGQNT